MKGHILFASAFSSPRKKNVEFASTPTDLMTMIHEDIFFNGSSFHAISKFT